jgi:hypothetical protein
MWYIVGYEDVRTALLDTTRMTTASAQSMIFDTFGAHVLTTEGPTHDRYRQALRHPFTPASNRCLERTRAVCRETSLLVDQRSNAAALSLFLIKIRLIGVVRDAGCMRQQLPNRYRLPRLRARIQVLANGISHLQPMPLLQLHDQGRRKLFRNRPNSKFSLGCPESKDRHG